MFFNGSRNYLSSAALYILTGSKQKLKLLKRYKLLFSLFPCYVSFSIEEKKCNKVAYQTKDFITFYIKFKCSLIKEVIKSCYCHLTGHRSGIADKLFSNRWAMLPRPSMVGVSD